MEALQITAGERRLILFLITAILVVTGFTHLFPPRTIYDMSYYEPVIAEFERLSGVEERDRQIILAQYYPRHKRNVFQKAIQQSPMAVPPEPLVTINLQLARPYLKEYTSAHLSSGEDGMTTSEKHDTKELDSYDRTGGDRNKSGDKIEQVNIQKAGKDELTRLPGIGPVTAERIVSYRNENGLFSKPEDLLNVSGIGPVTLENIRKHITLEEE